MGLLRRTGSSPEHSPSCLNSGPSQPTERTPRTPPTCLIAMHLASRDIPEHSRSRESRFSARPPHQELDERLLFQLWLPLGKRAEEGSSLPLRPDPVYRHVSSVLRN